MGEGDKREGDTLSVDDWQSPGWWGVQKGLWKGIVDNMCEERCKTNEAPMINWKGIQIIGLTLTTTLTFAIPFYF